MRLLVRCGRVLSFGLVLGALTGIFLLSGLSPEPFWRAWAATGARTDQFYFTSWGVLSNRFSKVGDLEREADLVTRDLGFSDKAVPSVTVGGLFRQVRMVQAGFPQETGDGVTVVTQTLNQHPGLGEKPVTYLVIDAKSASLTGIKREMRRIQALYRRLSVQPWQDVSATGTIRGRLDPARYQALRRKVLTVLAASYVEGVGGNVSALSPVLQSSITVAGKEINLQLAVVYDPSRDATKVSLGTPVLPAN